MTETTATAGHGPEGRPADPAGGRPAGAPRARARSEVAIGQVQSDYFGPHGVNTGPGERVFGAAIEGKAAGALGAHGCPALAELPPGPGPGRWSSWAIATRWPARAHLPVYPSLRCASSSSACMPRSGRTRRSSWRYRRSAPWVLFVPMMREVALSCTSGTSPGSRTVGVRDRLRAVPPHATGRGDRDDGPPAAQRAGRRGPARRTA